MALSAHQFESPLVLAAETTFCFRAWEHPFLQWCRLNKHARLKLYSQGITYTDP